MAIDSYKLKNGQTRYRATIYINGERIKQQRGFKTKKEARDFEARVRIEGAPKPKKTYDEVEKLYLASLENKREESTIYNLEKRLQKHIPKYWRRRNIAAIKPEECQQYVNDIANDFAPSSAKIFVSDANKVFEYAFNLELVKRNPFNQIIKPSGGESNAEEKWAMWTPEQIGLFLETAANTGNPFMYPLFRLVLFSGMRRSEAIGIRWKDFDYERRTISIVNAVVVGRHGAQTERHPKNHSERVIMIDAETADAIEALRGFATTERIFPFCATTALRWFRKVEKDAGLPHSRLHNLRHEHCTVLLENGAYLKDVQQRLGHKDANTTLNIYAHANKDKAKVLEHLPENHYTAHYTER